MIPTMIKSINPYNQQVLKSLTQHSLQQVEGIISSSQQAFVGWPAESIEDRSQITYEIEEKLLENIDLYANMMSLEMGKLESFAILKQSS